MPGYVYQSTICVHQPRPTTAAADQIDKFAKEKGTSSIILTQASPSPKKLGIEAIKDRYSRFQTHQAFQSSASSQVPASTLSKRRAPSYICDLNRAVYCYRPKPKVDWAYHITTTILIVW